MVGGNVSVVNGVIHYLFPSVTQGKPRGNYTCQLLSGRRGEWAATHPNLGQRGQNDETAAPSTTEILRLHTAVGWVNETCYCELQYLDSNSTQTMYVYLNTSRLWCSFYLYKILSLLKWDSQVSSSWGTTLSAATTEGDAAERSCCQCLPRAPVDYPHNSLLLQKTPWHFLVSCCAGERRYWSPASAFTSGR